MNRQQRRAEKKSGGSSHKVFPIKQHCATVYTAFTEALQHHQAGRLCEAEALYRRVLAANTRHADSLHLLGVLASQTQRYDLAIELICKAIAVNTQAASYHSNLGNTLRDLGRLDEAAKCYRKAVNLEPSAAYTHSNLGNVLREQGNLDEAVAYCRKAIKLKPDYPEAHSNLGNVLQQQGHLDEAVAHYRKAIKLKQNFPDAYRNLGNVLQQQGHLDEAVACCRRAIEFKPDFPAGHSDLANALKEQGHLDEAVACCRRAIKLKPDYPEAHSGLGSALQEQGHPDEAVACCRRAIELKPDYPEAHINLGCALQQQGHLDEAVACYRRAIELKPDFANAHFNLALALLAQGDMGIGWEEYEWRWRKPQIISHHLSFAQTQWRGEEAEGRTLLIHAEQGLGDTLQFCRYAALAAARGLRVIMEVQGPLVRLLRSLAGVNLVMARGEELPPFDLHCPMLSMPLALGTSLTSIPSAVSYLHADAGLVSFWRTHLASLAKPGLRVGLVWAGSPRNHSPELAAVDRRRSMSPDRLAPLFNIPGLHMFSLQKGGPAAPQNVPLTDFMDEMGDFADTAALIANLDLVISVDTAVAHLAAALGKPVWLLDRFDPDWRWLVGRHDSPWYPSLRIYRQPKAGDWDSVLTEVVQDLSRLAKSKSLTADPSSIV